MGTISTVIPIAINARKRRLSRSGLKRNRPRVLFLMGSPGVKLLNPLHDFRVLTVGRATSISSASSATVREGAFLISFLRPPLIRKAEIGHEPWPAKAFSTRL